ncbi:MAG: hypothetical protein LBB10_01100 [Bifidobacteriaceae bacterium]|jgi:hypothetical protein|nr:hypothetical protein [Bifidobacteriaceae bacterium]
MQKMILRLKSYKLLSYKTAILFSFIVFAIFIALFRYQTSLIWSSDNGLDIYVYQIIGNAWNHGVLPYKDLFDMKGPAWYMLWFVFAFISPWSNTAPFIFLIFIYTISFIFAFKILKLFLSNFASYLVSVIYIFIAFTTDCTYTGFSSSFYVEEIIYPIALLFIYTILKDFYFKQKVNRYVYFINGVLFGFIVWSKYQLIGIWAGITFGLLIYAIGKKIKWKKLLQNMLIFLSGLALFTIFIIFVLYLNGNLRDMFRCYFFSKPGNYSLYQIIADWPNIHDFLFYSNFLYLGSIWSILIIILLVSLFFKSPFKNFRIVIISCFVINSFVETVLLYHPYNWQVVFIPTIFAFIFLGYTFRKFEPKKFFKKSLAIGLSVLFLMIFYIQISVFHDDDRVSVFNENNKMIPLYDPVMEHYLGGGENAGKFLSEYINLHSTDNSVFVWSYIGANYSTYFYNKQIPDNYYFFPTAMNDLLKADFDTKRIYATKKYKWVIRSIAPSKYPILDTTFTLKQLKAIFPDFYLWKNYKPVIAVNQMQFTTVLFERDD